MSKFTWHRQVLGLVALAAFLAAASACGDSEGSSAAGVPPAITVLGQGEASAEPDGVTLRMSIATRDPFRSRIARPVPVPAEGAEGAPGIRDPIPEPEFTPPEISIITKEKLEPVLQALSDQGVPDEDISVNPFWVGSPGAARVDLVVSRARPSQVEQLVKAVQQALSEQGQYSLQNFSAVFTVGECGLLEKQARQQALANARSRAEELARDAGVWLGPVAAISEIPSPLPFFFGPSGGGGSGALEAAAEGGDFPGEVFGFATSPSIVEVSESLSVTYRLEE